ncbi:hypothetical protein NUU61_006526 [Penicillium alfredii]|uniref:Peptidase S33 tripeptidyl aminopeptidase-like C-terminal domain-containing protein n=1 Tax=Penicillium alfredii TaxID=1506179 RepID=A0A9W9F186_9EURO|nr:uncharacterized protein NUU61_006526 [Penicillium alfredii]KAJ5091656.1 hypothetical protein NUU61_006526 [Penicillium alfredii]
MVHDWKAVPSSPHLQWTPCFSNFTCAKLEVPLDYGDTSRGTADIALIKLSAQNKTKDTQDVLINPGGPGGSGVEVLLNSGTALTQIIGEQHNIVGFDPRGVNQSGPVVNCWPGHPERRAQFEKLFYPEVSNASSTSLSTQFYAAEIFGKACTATTGGSNGNASFVSTPAVARDLLTYIDAAQALSGKKEGKAKISYYGVSYGTVIGVTFASLFPDRVGKMILDGTLDASDYYNLGWKTSISDADKALDSFFKYCHQAGAEKCSFWRPSAKSISSRMDTLVAKIKSHPIPTPSSKACGIPLLATYSDLKQITLQAMYSPLSRFPTLAEVLSGLEKGNTTAFISAVTDLGLPSNPCSNGTEGSTEDINTLIKCVDEYDGHKFKDIGQYRDYVDTLTSQSKFFGEVWPNNANTVSCRALKVDPPKSGRLPGSILETRNTSFPILFVNAEIDPVTPKRGAQKMASVFPGSKLLIQNSTGHTAIASASSCLMKNVRAYFSGHLPSANTICQPDQVPFQGSAASDFGLRR